MSASVTHLAFAPVKGMRLVAVPELEIGATGATGDRTFFVVDPEHQLLLTGRHPRLVQIVPRWEHGVLTLRFPDGKEVAAVPEPGPPATTHNYEGRPIAGRIVDGPFAAALSEQLGQPVQLLARNPGVRGPDDAPITVMSQASLAALAPALDGAVPDARRFRMSIAIDGVDAWEEHGWGGREITVGDVGLRGVDPVERCVVTTRDPDTGRRDVPTLHALAELRGKRDVTFGLWCEVLRPGRVRIGDAVLASA